MANYNRWKSLLPPVTMHLLIINCIMWVATMLLAQRNIVDLERLLGLHFWKGSDFQFYQFFTYMFMHDSSSFSTGIMHLFFNMFALWMFGQLLEKVMGMKRYLLFYIVCGIGAGLIQEIVWQFSWQSILADINHMSTAAMNEAIQIGAVPDSVMGMFYNNLVTVGASGAVFGILLAFAMLFPNVKLYIMFIPIPVKAKYAVIGFAVIELFFGVSGVMSSVAHFAHLGGMLFGLVLLLYWRKKGVFNNHHVIS